MKKELLIVTETLGVDGPERVISELVNEWQKKGYQIVVILTRSELGNQRYSINDSIEIIKVDAHRKGGILSRFNEARGVRKIIKQHPDAVCISLLVSTSFSLAIGALGLKNRVILSERNDPNQVPFTKLQRIMRNLSLELADACVFQTNDAKEYFSKRIQNKGTIIFNPINPNLPEIYSGERKKEIVAVGRLAKQKNFLLLIKAFASVAKKHPDYKLYIYGEGPERDKLEAEVLKLGLQQNVFMPGFSNNVYNKMIDSTAYVSSSDYEGMSNSMLEALAMGVPTICTDCPIGGARTVIENGINGVLTPVGECDPLTSAILKVIEDESFRIRLSNNAYMIREKLNINDISEQWIKIFEGF